MKIQEITMNEIFDEKVAKEVFGTHDITLPNGEVIKSWIHHLSRLTLSEDPEEYLKSYIDKLTKTK